MAVEEKALYFLYFLRLSGLTHGLKIQSLSTNFQLAHSVPGLFPLHIQRTPYKLVSGAQMTAEGDM